MSKKLIADYEEIKSPFFSSIFYPGLTFLFYTGVRLLFDLRIKGLENFQFRPSTLIITNHKRDLDVVVIGPTLYFCKKRSSRSPIHFIAREDLFEPGFLAEMVPFPQWIRRRLNSFNLNSLMRSLHAYPIRRFPECTVKEILTEAREIFGNREISRILKPEWQEKFRIRARIVGKDEKWLRLNDILHWDFREIWCPPGRINILRGKEIQEVMQKRQREIIDKQLSWFVKILDRGGIVFLTPEGTLSPDGKFCRIRDALYRLVWEAKVSLHLLPVNITYDFMNRKKISIFLNVGQEIDGLENLGRTALEAVARSRILALLVITFSQLASFYLWQKAQKSILSIKTEDFIHELWGMVVESKNSRLPIDERLLDPKYFHRQLNGLLEFCSQRVPPILYQSAGQLRLNFSAILDDTQKTWKGNPVCYGVNELEPFHSILRTIYQKVSLPG